jgi:hypothetical protein
VLLIALVAYLVWPHGCASAKSCKELRDASEGGKGWPLHTVGAFRSSALPHRIEGKIHRVDPKFAS